MVLDRLDVLCLPALRAFYNVELNLLTFLQTAEAVGLNGGEVNENVLAVLAADETIALGVVKPLYCSCFHGVACVPLVLKYALNFRRKLQAGHAVERGTAYNRKDQTHLKSTDFCGK